MLEKINKFIEYWWFRYLLATELYIVEKWERVTMRKCWKSAFFLINSNDDSTQFSNPSILILAFIFFLMLFQM